MLLLSAVTIVSLIVSHFCCYQYTIIAVPLCVTVLLSMLQNCNCVSMSLCHRTCQCHRAVSVLQSCQSQYCYCVTVLQYVSLSQCCHQCHSPAVIVSQYSYCVSLLQHTSESKRCCQCHNTVAVSVHHCITGLS